MTERPIIFSAPMVIALREGRKTQTRPIVKSQPDTEDVRFEPAFREWYCEGGVWHKQCQYGVPGDRLWVRETFYHDPEDRVLLYRADGGMDVEMFDAGCKWQPSIFMPRARSRITLEITGVRVERLQDISNEDAEAEGIEVPRCPKCSYTYQDCLRHMDHNLCGEEAPASAVYAYSLLWDSLNAKRAPWASNPWVWVLSFNVVKGKP